MYNAKNTVQISNFLRIVLTWFLKGEIFCVIFSLPASVVL